MAGWVDVVRRALRWLSGVQVDAEGWEVERIDIQTSFITTDIKLFPEYSADVEIQTAFTVERLKVSGS